MAPQNIVRLDKVSNADIWIDSPQWVEWLAQCTSFRYEGKSSSFNCTKRQNGKWYGTKKIYSSSGSKAVSLYIGSTCSLDKLQELEYYFNLDWKDFWKWYYSAERKQTKTKVVQPTACTTDEGDVATLRAEIEQLRAELAASSSRSPLTNPEQPDQPEPTHHWAVGDTLKSRAWIKTQFRLSDRKSREDEIIAPDGSLWRRLSEKQSAEFAKRLMEKPNTVYYKCVG